jgi:hypothetical protein
MLAYLKGDQYSMSDLFFLLFLGQPLTRCFRHGMYHERLGVFASDREVAVNVQSAYTFDTSTGLKVMEHSVEDKMLNVRLEEDII